jgi:multicomponent Na+:H+ antiporter subunit B
VDILAPHNLPETFTLAILVGLAVAAVRLRDLLGATAVLGAYSLMMALLWCEMNALDVGFTEAAVGAGISTVLLLAAISRIGRRESARPHGHLIKPALWSMRELRLRLAAEDARPRRTARLGALLVCALVAAALLYGTRHMPQVGDANSPANASWKVAQHYLNESKKEVGPPNVVTSVLGDYRGYDTMGETVVIFTAALCVLLLLRQARGGRRRGDA